MINQLTVAFRSTFSLLKSSLMIRCRSSAKSSRIMDCGLVLLRSYMVSGSTVLGSADCFSRTNIADELASYFWFVWAWMVLSWISEMVSVIRSIDWLVSVASTTLFRLFKELSRNRMISLSSGHMASSCG